MAKKESDEMIHTHTHAQLHKECIYVTNPFGHIKCYFPTLNFAMNCVHYMLGFDT